MFSFFLHFQRPPSSSLSAYGLGNDEARSPSSGGGTPGLLSHQPGSHISGDNISEAGKTPKLFEFNWIDHSNANIYPRLEVEIRKNLRKYYVYTFHLSCLDINISNKTKNGILTVLQFVYKPYFISICMSIAI